MHRRAFAILGAGPIGLEAAAALRAAGQTVLVFERRLVGEHLQRWGHLQMFSPWQMNVTAWGLAAVRELRPDFALSDPERCPTGHELLKGYIEPLAQTLGDAVLTGHRVIMVGRHDLLKGELLGDPARSARPFRLLIRDTYGRDRIFAADVVFDCTGTFAQPACLGNGGIPAPGEQAASEFVDYTPPDVEGEGRPLYAGGRTLLVGGGHSAASTALGLARLAAAVPGTRVAWVLRTAAGEPFAAAADDPLPGRRQIEAEANALLREPPDAFDVRRGAGVESIDHHGNALLVHLRERTARGSRETELTVDRIIANVGYRPDRDIYRELQVHECYASDGPINLAATLRAGGSADCLQQAAPGIEQLRNPEPQFFILGVKSYGRHSSFLLRTGHEQIRAVLEALHLRVRKCEPGRLLRGHVA